MALVDEVTEKYRDGLRWGKVANKNNGTIGDEEGPRGRENCEAKVLEEQLPIIMKNHLAMRKARKTKRTVK